MHLFQAICDANAKIFRTAVRAVKDATPDGFAAIKLSGLGSPDSIAHVHYRCMNTAARFIYISSLLPRNPHLLERMSSCLGEICRLQPGKFQGARRDVSTARISAMMAEVQEVIERRGFDRAVL